MKETKETAKAQEMTNSQAKRAARKKEAERLKKKDRIGNVVQWLITIAVAAGIIFLIAAAVVKAANKVAASDNYSACLDANGLVSGISSGDFTLPEYKNMQVPLSEVEYTDDEVQSDIDSQLNQHKELNSDTSLVVADGDEVNIDYVGTVDGVEFDGGSAQGYDLTIGSGAFIPGFEEQIIGAQVGTSFDINVTFPDDYNDELAGKDAVFAITLNGIEEKPEFTDEFVASYLSEYASTVEEYKQYLKDTNLQKNLKTYVENTLEENTTVNKYNRKYLKNLKSTTKFDDQKDYENSIQMYEMYMGYNPYGSFEDYNGMSEDEYEESVVEKAKEAYRNNVMYQTIFQNEGLSVDGSYYKNVLIDQGYDESEYDTQVETYGEPAVMQKAIKEKVLEYVTANAVVK